MLYQDLLILLGMRVENEPKSQQAVCYKADHEIGRLDVEGESEDLKLTYLLCHSTCFSGKFAWLALRECALKLGQG